ncbi:MAG TPA: flagella basal body P-ring formation protein FlgA [Thiopseudomonas sp.]|nr:flagella basal body P-ring formation protein FlgA [Thiopseudomonas sp.]
MQASDVQLAEREMSGLRQGYLLDLGNVIGQQVTRPVRPNQVIATHALGAKAISLAAAQPTQRTTWTISYHQ